MPKLIDVIKYEGDNTTFVWKHPAEDFNIGSQLIVHESQEAIFFSNGQALDIFGPGRYTLETLNIPIIGKFLNRLAGDQSPFHCEVYFINKIEQMAIKWGTDSKVEYMEPTYNFPLQIGASGEMSLVVENSALLLSKVVGTEQGLTQAGLAQRFRMFIMPRVKTHLAKLIKSEKINIFEIDEHLTNMSGSIQQQLAIDFSEYGIRLMHFFLNTIVKPEDDRMYQKFKELHFRKFADVAEAQLRQQVGMIDQETQAQRMIVESHGLARKREQEGYSYQEERSFDVAERAAANEGVGQFTNMGIGLGVMSGVGVTVGGAVQNAVSYQGVEEKQDANPCGNCGKLLPADAKFCPECGTAKVKICSGCGKESPLNGKFCLECGQKL
jgi:Putative virion core protein (lumpy skin disease virus)